MKYIYLLISLAIVSTTKAQNRFTGSIQFDHIDHDFGRVLEEDGKKEMTFYFTNTGKTNIAITDVKASCGCTLVDYTHDSVAPNKSGSISVIFDPTGRKGEFMKTITVYSTTQPAMNFLTVKGDIVPRAKGPKDFYPTLLGSLRFNTTHFQMGDVRNNTSDTFQLLCYNESKSTVNIDGFEGPPFIKFSALRYHGRVPSPTKTIEPGEAITIQAIFDGKKSPELGGGFNNIKMKTTDSLSPNKAMYVSYNVLEHFAKLAKKDSLLAPHIVFAKTSHDWGMVNQGDQAHTTFDFKNTGKSNLIIRKTSASCGCTASTPEKTELKPGESSTLKVTYNSAGRQGNEKKTITVITNDPYQSVVTLQIKAEVKVNKPAEK
jgi:archaellum component FlaG (FlaF/FlaG flagellin family)